MIAISKFRVYLVLIVLLILCSGTVPYLDDLASFGKHITNSDYAYADSSYDALAAVDYSNTWWNDRNPSYTDYTTLGGDCANFVSQCLIAGGLNLSVCSSCVNVDAHGSLPWCDDIHTYLTQYLGVQWEQRTSSQGEPSWFLPGDVAIFGDSADPWRHAVFCVTGDASNYATCNAHTTDRYHKTIQWFFDNSSWTLCNYYNIEASSLPDKFTIGDNVQVTSNVNVRTGPGTSFPEISDPEYTADNWCAPAGKTGTVLDGPVSANTYIWWEVDYGPGDYTGWSIENALEAYSGGSCWSTSALSNAELADLIIRHFPDGTVPQTGESIRVTAYAVARAESGGNPTACGDIDVPQLGELSIGLYQINTYWHPEYDENQLFDADYNAEAASIISSNGADWNAWCTWESSACGGNGNESYRQFLDEARQALGIPSCPSLLAPPNNHHFQYPSRDADMQWTSVSGASKYELSLRHPNTTTFLTVETTSTSYVYPMSIMGEHNWKVRAYVNGQWTDPSETWSYYFDGWQPPSLISPTNGDEVDVLRPTLHWMSVSEAGFYTIQVATDSSFMNIVEQQDLAQTSWQVSQDLTPGETYYWRACCLSPESDWSATWHFDVAPQCGTMGVSPTSWSPTIECGSSDNQLVTVSASGGDVEGVMVNKQSGPTWLNVSSASLGDISSGSSKNFTMIASPPPGTEGNFSYTVRVSNTCDNPSTIDVTGTITVAPLPCGTMEVSHTLWNPTIQCGSDDHRGVTVWAVSGPIEGVTVTKLSGPSWLGPDLLDHGDIPSGNGWTFNIDALPPAGTSGAFPYTVRVSNTCGNPSIIDVTGTITVECDDPCALTVGSYDENQNNQWEFSEAVTAVTDYLVFQTIDRDVAIGIVTGYLMGWTVSDAANNICGE